MYHVYFENISHITFKWYKYTIFYIMFIYSWSYHPMNLKYFHYVMKVLLHMQRTCWHVLENNHKICTFFCYSNLYQMLSNFVWALIYLQKVGHVCNHSKIFLHVYIETFLHDWLKWFQMSLMTKIVHNLSSWLKKKVVHLILM
jgi:hypothetical protein